MDRGDTKPHNDPAPLSNREESTGSWLCNHFLGCKVPSRLDTIDSQCRSSRKGLGQVCTQHTIFQACHYIASVDFTLQSISIAYTFGCGCHQKGTFPLRNLLLRAEIEELRAAQAAVSWEATTWAVWERHKRPFSTAASLRATCKTKRPKERPSCFNFTLIVCLNLQDDDDVDD